MKYQFDRVSDDAEEVDLEVDSGWSRSLYGSLAGSFAGIYHATLGRTGFSDRFQTKLDAANINTTTDLWLSGACAIGSIAGGLFVLLSSLLTVFGILPVFYPEISLSFMPVEVGQTISVLSAILGVLLYAGIGSLIGMSIGICLAIYAPYRLAKSRARKIEIVQPDAIAYMHALSTSGMDQMEVFRTVAKSQHVFSEFSVELRRVMHLVENSDEDFTSAIQQVVETTPNDDFRQFLSGMISTLGSGGDLVQYLEDAKNRTQKDRERRLNTILDYIRLLGEAFTSLRLMPMLLVIVLTIMALAGSANLFFLVLVVYCLQPIIAAGYGIGVASLKIDKVGDGYLRTDEGEIPGRIGESPFEMTTIEQYVGQHPIFSRMHRREAEARLTKYILEDPKSLFIEYPRALFAITIPITLLGYGVMVFFGLLTFTVDGFAAEPVLQTVLWIYWPLLATLVPYSVAYLYQQRARAGIKDTLAKDFESLAEINSNGQPLPEAMAEVAKTSNSKLASEFGIIYKKLKFGRPITYSIKEFANKYKDPELSRQLKILEKASDVSSEISDVLRTAADTAEAKQEIAKTRRAKMSIQFGILEAGFVVFLLIMAGMNIALTEFATGLIPEESDILGSNTVESGKLQIIFLHSVVIQGFFTGLLGGYVQTNKFGSGVKYAIINIMIVLVVWLLAIQILKPILMG